MPQIGSVARVQKVPRDRGRTARWLLLAVNLMVSGCATLDNFGNRAIRYNIAASDTKTRAILMNVMRAAYREPLQFSDVSTVTGQNSLSGTLAASLPVTEAAANYVVSPSASLSGSSQFNVTNLNTQEFYNGLETPVTLQQISNLIDAGFDPALVLFLTVSDLNISTVETIDGKPVKRFVVIHSNAESADDFGTTYNALVNMAEAGFSAQTTEPTPFGPILSEKEVQNSRMVAAIQARAAGDLVLKQTDDTHFQFFQSGDFTICFNAMIATPSDRERQERQRLGLERFTAYHSKTEADRFKEFELVLARYRDPVTGRENQVVPGMALTVRQQNICGYKPDHKGKKPDDKYRQSFTLKTRSLEGVFQFLGDIVRHQNAIGSNTKPNAMAVGNSYIFRVQTARPAVPAFDVVMHSHTYYVAGDPNGKADYSSQVMQIVTDLLALQSSAKNIPSPGVLTVISR